MGIESLITLIVLIIVFAALFIGAMYICDRSSFPQPVKWIVGAVFLIILLMFAARLFGSGDLPILHWNK